ncbi:uncharacterized protein FOMMEDRAFT_157714 [Fomitiporia mediterranea MF3/22]|uniref:uncharacterized protein n=1 Tax=Fomitiporia mediterranea (strain MF3/22) TaxID=694068 RepID=UPI00044074F8|nr:uncharacterized protein FOMMEDRAFT_157714 [Fomitiporia mediterranea MF3/22]EJD02491.1 hypothetical protein FOMMEDRAFT_157714 [Fomitiporia mediterranea MF3/22]
MPTPVLLSRSLDPLLGIFTGVFAFYLHQTNPRTAPPAGETFKDLVCWKRDKWKASRSKVFHLEKDSEAEAMLATLLKEDKTGEQTQ